MRPKRPYCAGFLGSEKQADCCFTPCLFDKQVESAGKIEAVRIARDDDHGNARSRGMPAGGSAALDVPSQTGHTRWPAGRGTAGVDAPGGPKGAGRLRQPARARAMHYLSAGARRAGGRRTHQMPPAKGRRRQQDCCGPSFPPPAGPPCPSPRRRGVPAGPMPAPCPAPISPAFNRGGAKTPPLGAVLGQSSRRAPGRTLVRGAAHAREFETDNIYAAESGHVLEWLSSLSGGRWRPEGGSITDEEYKGVWRKLSGVAG